MKLFELIEEALQFTFVVGSLPNLSFRHLVYNNRLITVFYFSVFVIVFNVEPILLHCLRVILSRMVVHFDVAEILLLYHEIAVQVPGKHERDEAKSQ